MKSDFENRINIPGLENIENNYDNNFNEDTDNDFVNNALEKAMTSCNKLRGGMMTSVLQFFGIIFIYFVARVLYPLFKSIIKLSITGNDDINKD